LEFFPLTLQLIVKTLFLLIISQFMILGCELTGNTIAYAF